MAFWLKTQQNIAFPQNHDIRQKITVSMNFFPTSALNEQKVCSKLSLLRPKCLFDPITFSRESDYRLANACHLTHFYYIIMHP